MRKVKASAATGTCFFTLFIKAWRRNFSVKKSVKSSFVPREGGRSRAFYKNAKSFSLPRGGGVALFNDKNRGKSHQRKAPRPPLQTTSHPVESAARSNARQVCAIDGAKISSLSLITSSAIPRVRTKYAAKSEQIRWGGLAPAVAFRKSAGIYFPLRRKRRCTFA